MAQNPAAMQQKMTILNKHNEKLVGVLHETRSTEIVVLCHGFLSSKEYNIMFIIANALQSEGISAFRFDFAGSGESEGSFQINYFREAGDLRAVIDYFTGANRTVVAILGHSKGGDVVLLYASKYQDIPAVVSVSGRFDLKRGIEERLGKEFLERIEKDGYIDVKTRKGEFDFKVTKESLMEILKTNMHEACLSIDKRCRVLIVHGSADELVPVEGALEFAKIISNNRLQIIEGATHGYTSHEAELVSVILPFIKECLQHGKNASE
ncbi:alpha/beta-Hydrolases superfamily protein [Abeliophyllum distichum]|uniref:Alpha/beta-Hydrolases superfamily protein n=1 Tax=Abeliophyllum distichum TaxID=126358 RepID=A0ABD1QVA9_9LAMI